jgi:hypothetical protein
MDAGEQLAAEIVDAIRSGRDLYLFDQFVAGPDRLQRALQLLLERRSACSGVDEAALLAVIIATVEKEVELDGRQSESR